MGPSTAVLYSNKEEERRKQLKAAGTSRGRPLSCFFCNKIYMSSETEFLVPRSQTEAGARAVWILFILKMRSRNVMRLHKDSHLRIRRPHKTRHTLIKYIRNNEYDGSLFVIYDKSQSVLTAKQIEKQDKWEKKFTTINNSEEIF